MTIAILTALALSLDPSGYKHVTFGDIPPTVYKADGDTLTADVKASASFLLLPFDKARKVKSVRFLWSSDGKLKIESAAREEEKDGDDSRLKVGLLLSGPAPTVPFFAPAWIKAIRDHMKKPSDRVLYLVAGSAHKPLARWKNPYSDSMEMLAVPSRPAAEKPWQEAHYESPEPLSVVGLWIMADGDNSRSSFKSRLKGLELSP